MKLSEFKILEKNDKRLGTALLLILSELNKTTILDIDASLRKATRYEQLKDEHIR